MRRLRRVTVVVGWMGLVHLLGLSADGIPHLLAADRQPAAVNRSVDDLVQQLFDENSTRKIEAARQLRQLGPQARPAVPALVELLSSEDVQVRVASLRALGAIGPEASEAVPAVAARLDDLALIDDGQVWLVAGETLGKIGGAAALDVVLPLLVPSEDDIRYRSACLVIYTMGEHGGPAVPRLVEILEANQEPLGPPLYALEGIGPPAAPAVPGLITILDHENFHYQYFVCRILGAIGAEAQAAVPKVIERLQNGAPSVRRHAALALGKIGVSSGQEVVDALAAALSDPLAPVRQDAAVALGELGPAARSAAPKLVEALTIPNFPARAQAAASLWKIDASHKELVLKTLFDELEGQNAPWDAARELGLLAEEARIVDRLRNLLDSAPPEMQEQVVEAVGWMGEAGRPSIGRLRMIVADEQAEPDLRQAAREAIQRIESHRAAP